MRDAGDAHLRVPDVGTVAAPVEGEGAKVLFPAVFADVQAGQVDDAAVGSGADEGVVKHQGPEIILAVGGAVHADAARHGLGGIPHRADGGFVGGTFNVDVPFKVGREPDIRQVVEDFHHGEPLRFHAVGALIHFLFREAAFPASAGEGQQGEQGEYDFDAFHESNKHID